MWTTDTLTAILIQVVNDLLLIEGGPHTILPVEAIMHKGHRV
jgi:hypothetical protein